MEHIELTQIDQPFLQDRSPEPCSPEGAIAPLDSQRRNSPELRWIAPTNVKESPAEREPEPLAREDAVSRADREAPIGQSGMTIAEFVKYIFVPEHVANKKLPGRVHYQALLKFVLRQEEVDWAFQVRGGRSTSRLTAVPDWPYMGHLRLRDARPGHVQTLISAALAQGYSAQTVKHLKSVVRVLFAHAGKKKLLPGDNPAEPVTLPEMTRKEKPVLTLVQLKAVLAAMQYPEREMALLALMTGMTMAEICGLQWKDVNLTSDWCNLDGEAIPPRTIAVRRQWYGRELSCVNRKCRSKNLTIPGSLLPVLLSLKRRADFTSPNDFVLVSRNGTPVSEHWIMVRRLKVIGNELQMPWLSWHVFRHTRAELLCKFGVQFEGLLVRQSISPQPVAGPSGRSAFHAPLRPDSVSANVRFRSGRHDGAPCSNG